MLNVRNLVDIHSRIAGSGPGYKPNVEVLNKSAIVLAVACWEVYVKDLATFAFDTIFNGISDPKKFPQNVLVEAAQEIRQAKDARRLLELAGDGWRSVLKQHRDNLIAECNQRFTPNTKSINMLFETMIGFKSIASTWHWQGCSNQLALKKLDALLNLRHSIAHNVGSTRKVSKYDVILTLDLVNRLATQCSNGVRAYLVNEFKLQAWQQVSVQSPSQGAR